MFTEERQVAIEHLLHEQGKIRVRDLSEKFQVTEDCIRKDLKTLERAGKLKRTYGGAIISQEYPLERDVVNRKNYHIEKKRVIAEKALPLIKEREAIFLDVSTTNIELARLLAASDLQVTVVSNMIDILQIVASNPRITVVGTGGIMYPTVNGFLGSAAMDVISKYSFDKAFIGCCGMDHSDYMITTLGVEDGMTKRAAIMSSRKTYLMMEREKFYFNESYKFIHLNEIDGIITDEYPEHSEQQILVAHGVELY